MLGVEVLELKEWLMTLRQKYLGVALAVAIGLIGSVVGLRATIHHLHPYPTIDTLSGSAVDDYWCGETITLIGIVDANPSPGDATRGAIYRLVSPQGRQMTVESNIENGAMAPVGHRLSVTGRVMCEYLTTTETPFVVRLLETGRKDMN